jgi:hypothetical protein
LTNPKLDEGVYAAVGYRSMKILENHRIVALTIDDRVAIWDARLGQLLQVSLLCKKSFYSEQPSFILVRVFSLV